MKTWPRTQPKETLAAPSGYLKQRVGNAMKAADLRGCSSPEEDHPTQAEWEEVTARLSGEEGPGVTVKKPARAD